MKGITGAYTFNDMKGGNEPKRNGSHAKDDEKVGAGRWLLAFAISLALVKVAEGNRCRR